MRDHTRHYSVHAYMYVLIPKSHACIDSTVLMHVCMYLSQGYTKPCMYLCIDYSSVLMHVRMYLSQKYSHKNTYNLFINTVDINTSIAKPSKVY